LNRGVKLFATFFVFCTAIFAVGVAKSLVYPQIVRFGGSNLLLAPVAVVVGTMIFLSPFWLAVYLTRAWREDLRVLRDSAYWRARLVRIASRFKGLSASKKPVPIPKVRAGAADTAPSRLGSLIPQGVPESSAGESTRQSSSLSQIEELPHGANEIVSLPPPTRSIEFALGILKRKSVALAVLAVVGALAIFFLWRTIHQRTGGWVTTINPEYSSQPSFEARLDSILADHISASHRITDLVSEDESPQGKGASRAFWARIRGQTPTPEDQLAEANYNQMTWDILHAAVDGPMSSLSQSLERVEYRVLEPAPGTLTPDLVFWRFRFGVPPRFLSLVAAMEGSFEIIAVATLTDEDGYVLSTAESLFDEANITGVGHWSCWKSDGEEWPRFLASRSPVVFRGSGQGAFAPERARAVTVRFKLREATQEICK